MKNKGFLMMFFGVLLLLTACGNDDSAAEKDGNATTAKNSSEVEESFEKFDLKPEDTKAWMEIGPGTYPGEDFDEEAIKKEIDGWPKDLTSIDQFTRLMALTVDDYRPYQKFLDETEVAFSGISNEPGEMDVDQPNKEEAPVLHVQVLLDASGSMAGRLKGGTKMELAKQAVTEFVTTLPDDAYVSLRVYGHKGTNQPDGKAASCAETEQVYAFSHYDHDSFTQALNQFEPTGFTPIGKAIEEGGQDLMKAAEGKNVKSVMYVVSDGEETCGGDPEEAARQAQESDIEAIVNIIGFDIEDHERAALEAIAAAGKGKYYHADTGEELRESFRQEKNIVIEDWSNWSNENVDTFFDEERDYVDEATKLENEARTKVREEESIQRDLLRYIDEVHEDSEPVELRMLINTRASLMSSYLREHFYAIRTEARSGGYELRQNVREKGYEERQDLRQKKAE